MLSIVSLDGVGEDDAPEVLVLRTVMPPELKKRNAGFNRGGDRSIIDDASGNAAMATQANRVTINSRGIMVHLLKMKVGSELRMRHQLHALSTVESVRYKRL
jgi:hypothetical protein